MDDSTALVLALQLMALSCIAAALLLYLVCRLRGRGNGNGSGGGAVQGAVLVTACDTTIGLQTALHLAGLGYRVFAGLKEPQGQSVAAKALRAWNKAQEGEGEAELGSERGSLITLALDVTREDLLHEAVGTVRSHLPAGEDGLWAVINTAGLCCKGRLDQQESAHWDAMLKHNVVGSLRAARTFMPLLRNKRGRLINIGVSVRGAPGAGLVAYTAARYAVEGASAALRHEMAPHGIHVITLQPEGIATETLFAPPRNGSQPERQEADKNEGETVVEVHHVEAEFSVLPLRAMRTVEEALTSQAPKHSYHLMPLGSYNCLNQFVIKTRDKMMCFQNKNKQNT
ncbi:D-beta-hydroxybutyrate dehydrogenase, mitochondrial [Anabrus simplex]|uniref:D-beta-hydroxybutyrate dehydrogenase, mitochondrial n=1 Tax=Anabrus simplex TaxID=316456 RepID=UPI0035A2E4C1